MLFNTVPYKVNISKYLLIVALLFSNVAFATQQIPDELVIDGAKFEIDIYPLEQHPEYKKITKKLAPGSMCSANWRGHKGRWQIVNEYLVLDWLVTDACSKNPDYVDIADLFEIGSRPVKATWFTGEIVIRISERKSFLNNTDGLPSIEYQAIVYKIVAGKVISRIITTITK